MRNTLRFGLVLVAAALVLAEGTSAAAEEKRVCVLEIEGARDSDLREEVTRLIAAEHEIVAAEKFEKTEEAIGARKRNVRNMKAIATMIEADAVLEGSLVMEGEVYMLRFRVREGVSGRTVKKIALRLREPRLPSELGRELGKRLLSAIDKVPFVEPLDDADEAPEIEEGFADEDEGFADEEDEAFDEEDALRTRTARVDDDDDDEPLSARASEKADAPEGAMTPAERVREGIMIVRAGVSVTGRQLTFTTREGFEEAADFESPLAPGGFVSGEMYPLASPKRTDLTSKLGVGFSVDKVVGLKAAVGEMGTQVEVNETAWSVGVRYRHNFGDSPTSPTLKLSAGYGRMTAAFDRAAIPAGEVLDVPDVKYTYYDPGAELRFPLSETLALAVGGRALLITDAGSIQRLDQYGTATLTGFDASGGFEYLYGDRMIINVMGRFALVGYEFAGDGAETTDRDGDPMTVDIGGASDQYLGGRVTLGYLF
jgi:hypothetical protein